jgi:hypothetical protein
MKLKIFAYFIPLSFIFFPSVLFAGNTYKKEYDKFTNKVRTSYELDMGTECKLLKSNKSKLDGCVFVMIQDFVPCIGLFTNSNGWDIMGYSSIPPYSEERVYSIITYKNGKSMRVKLPALYSAGDTILGGTVMETVWVDLGSIRSDFKNIDYIEVKYGTNEYYIKLDEVLTKKALKFEK